MTEHRITLPYSTLPITLDDRSEDVLLAQHIQDAAEPILTNPFTPLTMRLHYEPNVLAARDTLNVRLVSTICADALRGAPTPHTVTEQPPQIRVHTGEPAIWLSITTPDEETPA